MNKKISALVSLTLAAALLGGGLSGCKEGGDREMSELPPESTTFSDTESSNSSTVSGGTSEDSLISSQTQSTVDSSTSSETSGYKQTGIPEDISKYIDGLDNGGLVFVDYTFTEDPAAITDKSALGDDLKAALDALKATDDYKKFSGRFSKDAPQARFSRPVDDFFTSGSPEAVFKGAIKDDFDRDGAEESFVLLTIAKDNGNEYWGERDYLVFVGDGGAKVIADYYNADFTAALDYGKCGQIIVDSEGWSGNDRLSHIWGVSSGKAAKLYGGRLNYEKTDCFLYSMGQQYIGDFAVFDINRGEYLAIRGKELSASEIAAMDGDNNTFNKEISRAVMIGGKYFEINGSCYTYENGRFVETDKKVRSSQTPGYTGEALKTLADINYDAALSSMTTPEEARKLN